MTRETRCNPTANRYSEMSGARNTQRRNSRTELKLSADDVLLMRRGWELLLQTYVVMSYVPSWRALRKPEVRRFYKHAAASRVCKLCDMLTCRFAGQLLASILWWIVLPRQNSYMKITVVYFHGWNGPATLLGRGVYPFHRVANRENFVVSAWCWLMRWRLHY